MAKKRRTTNIFDSSKEELEQISQNIIRSTAKNTPKPASAPEDKPKPKPKAKPVAVAKPKPVAAKPVPKPRPKEKKVEKAKLKVFWIGQEAHRRAKTAASMNGMTIRDYVEKLIQDDNA
jgi:outer membrane biosynthesis protein TonB